MFLFLVHLLFLFVLVFYDVGYRLFMIAKMFIYFIIVFIRIFILGIVLGIPLLIYVCKEKKKETPDEELLEVRKV